MYTKNVNSMFSLQEFIRLSKKNFPLLKCINEDGMLEWLFGDISFKDKYVEEEFGKRLYSKICTNKNTTQWTTKVCESLTKELFEMMSINIEKINHRKYKDSDGRIIQPDFDSKIGFIEVKSRKYSVGGTAGEKIFGIPWKYSDCFDRYNKGVYIICMGQQEKEAREIFRINDTCSKQKNMIMDMYADKLNIHYIFATDIIKYIAKTIFNMKIEENEFISSINNIKSK